MLIKGQPVHCLYGGIQDPSIFTSYMSKSVVFLMLSFDFYKLANFAPSSYTEPDFRDTLFSLLAPFCISLQMV